MGFYYYNFKYYNIDQPFLGHDLFILEINLRI